MESEEMGRLYQELAKLGVDVVTIREQNPTAEQLRDLLAGLIKLDSEKGGSS